MREVLKNIIFDALKELSAELENSELENPSLETKIYGIDGNLDSLALVSLIATLEERCESELDIELTLADEKAMSMRHSPFRDVNTLISYMESLIAK